jgi:biotin synthase
VTLGSADALSPTCRAVRWAFRAGTGVDTLGVPSQRVSERAPMNSPEPEFRHDWSVAEARSIYGTPFPDLIYRAQSVHRRHHDPRRVQLCELLSVKTGGCPEDCAYCPQSAHYSTGLEKENVLGVDVVLDRAREAKANGATRFCMGAAWREVRDGREFDAILDMVRGVRALDMEACCTLGMLTDDQARRLADAGLTAYNHNLDTGPGYYEKIISTRTYDDRLRTLRSVRRAGITMCCGGILGMGESLDDRLELLCVLAGIDPHPESVPINALVAVDGTPLAGREPVSPLEMARTIATARILLPRSILRLSAGRTQMTDAAQALCFLAGANSIFCGDKLLTTANPEPSADQRLLEALGMQPLTQPVRESCPERKNECESAEDSAPQLAGTAHDPSHRCAHGSK